MFLCYEFLHLLYRLNHAHDPDHDRDHVRTREPDHDHEHDSNPDRDRDRDNRLSNPDPDRDRDPELLNPDHVNPERNSVGFILFLRFYVMNFCITRNCTYYMD